MEAANYKAQILEALDACGACMAHLARRMDHLREEDERTEAGAEQYESHEYACHAAAIRALAKTMQSCMNVADDIDQFYQDHVEDDEDTDDEDEDEDED